MRSVDTNILARFVLRDDEAQVEMADEIVRQPFWIADTVLLELGWLLGRKLRLDRLAVADALLTVIGLDTSHMVDEAGMRWAIERFRSGADWADVVHLVTSREAATSFVTFDRNLAISAREDTLLPIETLA